MILRVAVVVAVVALALLVVSLVERRRGRRAVQLPSGVVVVTGAGCGLCAPTVAALEAHGVTPETLDVADLPASVGVVRSLPVVFVVDGAGEVLLRRSGRSALTDVPAIVKVAAAPA